jgi:hypothetical protein
MQRSPARESLSEQTVATARATILAVAPLVLLASFVYHPHIGMLPNADAVAHAVQADTQRWGIAHYGVAIGAALMALAYIALRGYLRDAGENRHSAIALPFLVMGSVLYAFLPGMEFSVLAATLTGGDVVGSQKAIDGWFVPTIMSSALLNAIGLACLARGVSRSAVLDSGVKPLVLIAFAVMAVSRFVPVGPVQFYVQGVAGVLALWPIAQEIARRTARERAAHSQGMPATQH